jgi:hypothetical protein
MRRPELTVTVTLLAVFAAMIAMAGGYPRAARLMPLVVGIPAALLALWEVRREWQAGQDGRAGSPAHVGQAAGLAWLVAFVLGIAAGGFLIGGTAAVVVAQRFWLRESWRTAFGGGIVAVVVLGGGIERGLGQPLFEGVVTRWAQAWLGL